MQFIESYPKKIDIIVHLFTATFSDSEGKAEGKVIGELIENLITTTSPHDLFVFSAVDAEEVVGAVIFTRLKYPKDERSVFLLSPLAVATSLQGKGIGQKLVLYALENLRERGAHVVLTYGDINFYGKVGFEQISESHAQPPLRLSYPQGWLGRSLNHQLFTPVLGESRCADALNDQTYW